MKAEIKTIPQKILIGKRLTMSFANNRTAELWRSFMPRRKEIINAIGTDLYSLQIYSPNFFANFNPTAEFEKWALIEVSDFDSVPQDMQTFILQGGLYAVFNYKGTAENAPQVFQYIFGSWLPNSEYQLDERPHFEILGDKFKAGDPNSEEEIWIPIREK